MARYFIRTHKLEQKLHLSPVPGQPTERRFLVQHRDAAVFALIAPAIGKLHDDPSWRRAVHGYQ
jgi:polar amino acid transport system substrate-binding protein